MSRELRCPECGAESAELIDPDQYRQMVWCNACENSSPNPIEWRIEYDHARMTDSELEELKAKRERAIAQKLPRPPRDKSL